MTRISLRQRNKLVIVQYIQQESTLEGEEEEEKENETEKGKKKTTTTVSGLPGCSTEPFNVFFYEPPSSTG